jgi:hypothetical protein
MDDYYGNRGGKRETNLREKSLRIIITTIITTIITSGRSNRKQLMTCAGGCGAR